MEQTQTDKSNNRKKRQRRHVVSEQEYTSTLDTIIQRDFYSDLPDLQLKMAVLTRRSQKDHVGAVRVRRAARQLRNHETSKGEQEAHDEQDCAVVRQTARPLERETLTGFHSRVTSEDNVEFERTQQQQVAAHRQRLELLFQTPAERRQQLLLMAENNDDHNNSSIPPSLASDEYNPPRSRISFTEWKKPPARNGMFFVPSPAMPSSSSLNSAAGTGNHHLSLKQDGHMMYADKQRMTEDDKDRELQNKVLMPPPPPPSQSSNNNQQQQTIMTSSVAGLATTASKQELVEYIPKHTLEKKIEPLQTRFPMSRAIATCLQEHRCAMATTTVEQRYLTTNNNKNSSATTESEYSTDASTDLETDGRSLPAERRARMKRQTREQQSFVTMTPLVLPGGSVEASPIVTWGTVAGTPLMIRPVVGDSVATSAAAAEEEEDSKPKASNFAVADESDRDLAARDALVVLEKRKARSKHNNSGGNSYKSAGKKRGNDMSRKRSTSTSSRRNMSSSFSPAAMSLLAKTSKQRNPSSARSGSAFASALRSSYTPERNGGSSTGSRIRGSTTTTSSSTRRGDHAYYKATPRIVSGTGACSDKPKRDVTTGEGKLERKLESITDGLLNLP